MEETRMMGLVVWIVGLLIIALIVFMGNRRFEDGFLHKKCGYLISPWFQFDKHEGTTLKPHYCRKCGELNPTFVKVIYRSKYPFVKEIKEVNEHQDI